MVVALVALFISLGGVSYGGWPPASSDSREIKNRTIRDKDVRGNSLTGRVIRESRLGKVPRATRADSATSAESVDRMRSVPRWRAGPRTSRCSTA